MPVTPCSRNGKRGHKWGEKGKCYTGPYSRAMAVKQGQAIHASKRGLGKVISPTSRK